MHERLEAIVIGRVQMVMYRDFAQRMAWSLKITGEVQNLPNGTVRIVAEGPKEKLERYVLKLNKGPLLAKVRGVEVSWGTATGEYKGFQINYA